MPVIPEEPEQQPIEAEPAEEPAEEQERFPIDREQLADEVREAIDTAIQAEEEESKND